MDETFVGYVFLVGAAMAVIIFLFGHWGWALACVASTFVLCSVLASPTQKVPAPTSAPRPLARSAPPALVANLAKLAELHQVGALSDSEYEAAKTRLLS